ncbi:MAG: cytochrome c oxidase subunit II [Chloroflexota bacterium]
MFVPLRSVIIRGLAIVGAPGRRRMPRQQRQMSFAHRIVLVAVPSVLGLITTGLIPSTALAASGTWPPPLQQPPDWNPGAPWAPLGPQSPEMSLISNLFWVVFVLAMIVLAFVVALLAISYFRYTAKPGDGEPPQVYGNRPIEIAWTIIPTFVLTLAFIATTYAIHDINTPATGGTPLDINAIGHQWWWEFQYPTLGVETANEVHVPLGVQLHFHVESADVIHSFWTPQLQRQIDANPGQDNAVFVKMTRPGIFAGMCYEYCGADHAWMKYRLVAQPKAQFDAWVKHENQPASRKVHGLVAYGRKVFLHQTCVSCHAINGTSAGGAVAPNLTHVGSRWAIGAGVAPNTIAGLDSWIYDPNGYKPGVLMPAYKVLAQRDIEALSAYLYSLK